ncbi:MAG: spore maturation protein [Bacilli bacterium]
MVNKIWAFFIIIGILFCIFTNKTELLNKEILISTKTAFDMTIKIFPVMALWLGIAKIAQEAGLFKKLSLKLSGFLKYVFPDIPKGHIAFSYISSNVIANMFGLGNAATPLGLKAMQSLQTLNPNKDTATRSMITFLVLNTTGFTLVPTTIVSLRMMYNSPNPTSIVAPCLIITLLTTISGLIIDRLFWRYHE